MKRSWNRRQFLRATGAAASAAVLGKSLLQPKAVRAATFTRRDVGTLTATDTLITSYAKAVKAMRALDTTSPLSPLSWTFQAAIHGTLAACPCPPTWNTCQHGTEFFWSWHRMYLHYFERIVRKMSGDSTWALPYWNWQLASEAQLPPMFRDTTSPLYTLNRNAAMNSGAGSLPSWATDCSTALADLDYSSAVLDIQTPHGNVHVNVGGWMGSVPTAAMDPIFYFHHSNVDRLWNIWLAQGGGRTDPLTDAAWKGQSYNFFDETGASVTLTDCEVLRAAQQLDYDYQGEPPQVNEYCNILLPYWVLELVVLLELPGPPVEIINETVSLQLNLGDEIQTIEEVAASTSKLFLVLGNIEAAVAPGLNYQVYINPPVGAVPEPKDAGYIGTFSLFGAGVKSEGHHGGAPASFRFKANKPVLTALRAGQELRLVIVPSDILVDGKADTPKTRATVTIGSLNFTKGTEVKK